MQHLLSTKQHRRLTAHEMAFVDSVWSKFRAQADVYGPGNDRDCMKLRRFQEIRNWNGQHIAGGPDKLSPGWIGFLHYHKVLPIGCGQLSHQCGCKLCINGLNVVHEPKHVNLGRRMCHKVIRRFEKEMRGTKGAVTGTVTVDRVGTVWRCQPKCNHEPRCFVNFGCARIKKTQSKRK